MKIYINGQFIEEKDAKISIFDHGMLYGYGIFENIRAYNGRVFRLKEHLDRLWASAKAINLTIPVMQIDIEKAIIETLLVNKLSDGYVKLIITRGSDSNIELDNKEQYTIAPSSIIIITSTISSLLYSEGIYEKGIDIITASVRRTKQDSLSPNIKSLNYLNNILAKNEAIRYRVMEAIMLNAEGYVVGCSKANIFILKNDILYTPSGSEGALVGITRDTVIELAKNKLKIPVKEERISIYNIYNADECFLTSTTSEIVPVVYADSRKIANGKPDKITIRLMKEFRNLTRLTGIPIK
ncbi:MAG: branched-chain-amino-acid transaminase [Endomicrobium sp.]|jgi:branched-chain amino acid aminotransferase|nr:branched-chain-amino-acid transaminase [Endomicrobium sp.]